MPWVRAGGPRVRSDPRFRGDRLGLVHCGYLHLRTYAFAHPPDR
jgi:hypothetical protein